MALITCFECGNEVSENAGTCPECGYPINNIENPDSGSPKKTSFTKSAGCLLQVISPFIFFIGLGVLIKMSYLLGCFLAITGAWLFVLGGKPTRHK